jgi:hypothetical protein
MKDFKIYICSAIVIFSAFAFVLTGCGGGGGGGGGGGPQEASLTTANAPQAGGAAIQVANLVGPTSALGELQTASISSKTYCETYSKPPLKSILDKVISISKTQRHKSEVHIAGSMPPTAENCSGGGTVTVSATCKPLPIVKTKNRLL